MASRLTEAAAQILLELAVHHDRSFDAPRKSLKEKKKKKKEEDYCKDDNARKCSYSSFKH